MNKEQIIGNKMNKEQIINDIGRNVDYAYEKGIEHTNKEWEAKIKKFENKLRENHFIMTEELLEELLNSPEKVLINSTQDTNLSKYPSKEYQNEK